MTLSITQAAKFALNPGAAEALEKAAINKGNLAWQGMAIKVKLARNAVYITTALTVIATTGAILSDSNTTIQYSCTTVTALGGVLTFFAAKKLYNATSTLQQYINAGARL